MKQSAALEARQGKGDADMLERITTDPKICHGQACVKGTRIPVFVVLEALASGMSIEQIIEDYPPLKIEDVRSCIYYASLIAREEEIPLGV
jgi:uncharacterized protein (DUF433 family)